MTKQDRLDLLWIREINTESLLVPDGLRRSISDHWPFITPMREIMESSGGSAEARDQRFRRPLLEIAKGPNAPCFEASLTLRADSPHPADWK